MAIDERELLKADAFRMTQRLAERLRDPQVTHQPQYDLPSAVGLIHNYVHRFNQPSRAVEFAFHFHNTVEIWGIWGTWAEALDTLLGWDSLEHTDRIRLLIFRGRAARGIGDKLGATSNASRALKLAEAHGNTSLTASALNQLAMIAFDHDEYVSSMAYLEQLNSFNTTHLSSQELGHLNLNIGNILVQQEKLKDAYTHFIQSKIYFQEQGNEIYSAKVDCNIADIYRREGKFDQAYTKIREAIYIFKVKGAYYSYSLAQNDLGCIYLQNRQWTEALDALKRALKGLEALGALATKAKVLSNIVELYVKTYQPEEVENASAEAYELARLCNMPLVTASLHVDYGLMLSKLGEHERACQLWSEALAIQESHGAKAAAKQTRTLLGNIIHS